MQCDLQEIINELKLPENRKDINDIGNLMWFTRNYKIYIHNNSEDKDKTEFALEMVKNKIRNV